MELKHSIDLIKYPIITDKATKLLESNQYTFAVDPSLDKHDIKLAIEYLFTVKVIAINTLVLPIKKRRVGKFVGNKSVYKKAVVTLSKQSSINLFSDTQ
uniref:ribosomal protein L23 n=1 Tax=Cryptomonas gyropyrenoidosa TaxID=233257 RepID=UPI00279D601A|nr:ribosomal protein L23 [Cryptomonas gyropyrenoidosa]WFQ83001.1 ribosomal protein L23 [Cryptomonas gyropyrenoidosa]